MKIAVKEWIENTLSKFSFINWDRFILFRLSDGCKVFGWIDRKKDNYKDFVLIEFDFTNKEVWLVGTSSKEYSEKISHILSPDDVHTDCQRVEDNFNIKNSIKLKR